MKLYIIRHGQTESNRGNKLLGITDESINDYGYKQIINVKENLKEIKFDVCFSSPFKRTLETASILCNEEIPIIIDDRLKERGFGILEGGSSNGKYTPDFWNFYINRNDYDVEPLKEHICLRTTDLELGSLWIRDIVYTQKEIAKLVGKYDMELISAISIGYSDEKPKQRARKKLNEIMEWYE